MLMKLITEILGHEDDLSFHRGDSDVTALMNEPAWDDIDVAVVDLLLPGTTGDALLSWLATHVPRVRRIAMSGSGAARLAEARDAQVTLLKPFLMDELLVAMRG